MCSWYVGIRDASATAVESIKSAVEVDIVSPWDADYASVEKALADYYGADMGGDQMPSPDDPAALRASLRAAAPRLAEVTDGIRGLFADGTCSVVVKRVGLADYELDQQRKAMFAFGALLGDLTETHPVDRRVVWDIQNREVPKPEGGNSTPYSKFSENDREAEYHTDAAIDPHPERFFMLYTVQQANCGGGATFVRDGRVLKHQLEATPEGRAAIAVLSEAKLPLRVPKAFRSRGYAAADGRTYTTVLADQPMWRWRRDKIEAGLTKYPEFATPQVRSALDEVDKLLAGEPDQVRQVTPDDALLIVDNHIALHGRTAFTDSGRHLLRVRFHDIS